MLGPSLTLRAFLDGYVVLCDGAVIAQAPSFLQATTLMRQYRATRAFAAEELRHVLSTTTKRRV